MATCSFAGSGSRSLSSPVLVLEPVVTPSPFSLLSAAAASSTGGTCAVSSAAISGSASECGWRTSSRTAAGEQGAAAAAAAVGCETSGSVHWLPSAPLGDLADGTAGGGPGGRGLVSGSGDTRLGATPGSVPLLSRGVLGGDNLQGKMGDFVLTLKHAVEKLRNCDVYPKRPPRAGKHELPASINVHRVQQDTSLKPWDPRYTVL